MKISLFIVLLFAFNVAAEIDHTLFVSAVYTTIYGGYIGPVLLETLDYKAIRSNAQFKAYISQISKPNEGSDLTTEETLALYLNAYSAYTIKLVSENPCIIRYGRYCYPTQSIRDLGTIKTDIWSLPHVTLLGLTMSLNDVRERIMNITSDPAFYGALSGTCISDPDITVFFPENIYEQVRTKMRRFIENKTKGARIYQETNTITLSKIFLWNRDAFLKHTGGDNILDYLEMIGDTKMKRQLESMKNATINYFFYDFKINDKLSLIKINT
ncbi:nudF-2 [Acrasis kona]|uniref:NudF-2 n=1 Tax=Acrasis kona TaxID=1008807 RepID=A0AAW2Z5L6_9EUKA